jgi:hypothetical protein
MAEEVVTILKVETGESIKSIGDLKDKIKELKKRLNETQIDSAEGWKDYQATLKELKVNQNALKDAMYATSASLTEVAASAQGASKSYNSLVHQMANLKEEWRATNDEARRNELGVQIAAINQQLKDMDASVGNFQRNVGNYESGVSGLVAKFDQWGGVLKQMPPTLGAAKESIGKVGESMQLIGKQPILGIIGLLAPIIIKITESLKGNKTAMDAVKKVMASLEPVFKIVEGLMEKLAQGIAKVADWFVEMMSNSKGTFSTIVAGAVGVGNALLQYLLTPIRTAVAAFKDLSNVVKNVFSGNFAQAWEDAKTAGEKIGESIKKGFSFKANFEEGKKIGEQFLAGLGDGSEKKAKTSGKSVGQKYAEGVKEGIEEEYEGFVEDDPWADMEAEKARTDALISELNDRFDAKEAALQREADMEKAVAEEVTDFLIDQEKKKKEATQNTIDVTMAAANATAQILNGVADLYESDEKSAEENAKKIKAMRISAATIEMLTGAVTAFVSAQTLPPPFGQIIGSINAASVIAMGTMNIAKIKATDPVKGTTTQASAPTAVSAPNIPTQLDSVRNITTASEEERLNRLSSSQRVYILQSDIEAAGQQSKVQIAESSF